MARAELCGWDPRPEHPIYRGLAPDVRHALLELNSCPKLHAYLHEHPHLYLHGISDVWPSGEVCALIEHYKREIRSLGEGIEWDDDVMLYVVER